MPFHSRGGGSGGSSKPKGSTSMVKSTVIPLCAVFVFVCVYFSATSRLTVFVSVPLPEPHVQRVVDGSTLQETSEDDAVADPLSTEMDDSQHIIRRYFGTPFAPTHNGSEHTTQEDTSLPKVTKTLAIVDGTCKPEEKIVYVKTHKTGSTTMASILERFGYLRNLSFAMSRGSHIISNEKTFQRSMAYQIPNRTRHDFDMLVNHVRYDRKEMDVSVPNAKYISIIRDPVTQLESAFGYFEMAQHLKIISKNPFETFMSNPRKYYARKSYFWSRSRNGQIYDLGFDHKDEEDERKVQAKIEQLDQDFDLIMITEYFDESLILLRKMMCWKYEDILYISNGIRSKSHRYVISDTMVDKIKKWSAADVKLYEHFNRTFWKKVDEYGPTFQQDLTHFKDLEKDAMKTCIDLSKNNTGDRREEKLTLKNNSNYCADLLRADVPYTALIRKGMVSRAAAEAAARANS